MTLVNTSDFSVDVGNYIPSSDSPMSDGLYYTCTIVLFLLTVFGLLGNSVCLYGSIKFNAVSVDNVSRVLLECLAVVDLCCVVTWMLVPCITLIARRWVLGSVVCVVHNFLVYSCFYIEAYIIQAISCFRIFSLLRPFSARALSPKSAVISVIVVSAVFIIYKIAGYIYFGNEYYFATDVLFCLSNAPEKTDGETTYRLVQRMLFYVLPLLMTILSNIGILIIVVKKSKQLPGRNCILTISCVCWTFLISSIPTILKIIFDTREWPNWYFYVRGLTLLNYIANPVIYAIANPRFKRFLMYFFQRKLNGFAATLLHDSKIQTEQGVTDMDHAHGIGARTPYSRNTIDDTVSPPGLKN